MGERCDLETVAEIRERVCRLEVVDPPSLPVEQAPVDGRLGQPRAELGDVSLEALRARDAQRAVRAHEPFERRNPDLTAGTVATATSSLSPVIWHGYAKRSAMAVTSNASKAAR